MRDRKARGRASPDSRLHAFLLVASALLALASCGRGSKTEPEAKAVPPEPLKVWIVLDTVDDWSTGVKEGFVRRLDSILAPSGGKVEYTIEDTKLDTAIAAGILERVRGEKPDLLVAAIYPNGFAGRQIVLPLAGAGIPCLAMEPTPVENGLIVSAAAPGGHVSGVGVFLQMNSLLRLARRVDPRFRRVTYLSWDAMTSINDWFAKELARACAEEGWEFKGSALVPDMESELDFLERFDDRSGLVIEGVSAFVDRAGKPVDMQSEGFRGYLTRGRAVVASYDPTQVQAGSPFGTTVIWDDIGAQLADMAEKVFAGTDPGTIPWEYPRSYNIMFNLPGMRRHGYEIPQDLLTAAYRIYTDYEGTFTGKVD